MPSTREVVASAARDDPERNLGARQHAADLADQPVAAHHHRDLAVARLARLVDRVLERLGLDCSVRDASPLERALELRQRLERPPACGGGVD